MGQYSIIHTALSEFISTHLEGVIGISNIKLLPDDDALMPQVNKKTFEIKYSYRTEILILLQNCNCDSLLLDYYFAVVCYLNNNFEDSRYFIKRIIDNIEVYSPQIKNDYPDIRDKVIYQLLFMVLHEVGHGLFGVSEELRTVFYKTVEEHVSIISNMYQTMISSFIFRFFTKIYLWKNKTRKALKRLMNNVGEKGDLWGKETLDTLKEFPEYIAKPRKKEELACDLFALRTFKYIMGQLEISEDDYKGFYSAGLNAIQFISRYMWWESFFVKQYSGDQYYTKTHMDPLRAIFFFEECRRNDDGDLSNAANEIGNEGLAHVPALKFESDAKYLIKLKDRMSSVGSGAIQIDEKVKTETMTLLLEAENKILSCVAE